MAADDGECILYAYRRPPNGSMRFKVGAKPQLLKPHQKRVRRFGLSVTSHLGSSNRRDLTRPNWYQVGVVPGKQPSRVDVHNLVPQASGNLYGLVIFEQGSKLRVAGPSTEVAIVQIAHVY